MLEIAVLRDHGPARWLRHIASLYPFRAKVAFARWRRAWRYARGTWTTDDADRIAYEASDVTERYPLEWVDVEGVLSLAQDQWGNLPELPALASRATARVASKWSGDGEIAGAAQDWALSLISEYATEDGIVLVEIDAD